MYPLQTRAWFVLLAVVACVASVTSCSDDDGGPVEDADVGGATGDVSGSGDADTATDTTDVSNELDPRFIELGAAIEADLELNNATAASVAVWLDDEVVWVGGFGELPEGGEIDENTLFMIGSDTKKLTALTALQAVERGLLTLDSTVGDVVPDLEMERAPTFLDATLHDLISHQGGIMDGVEVSTETNDNALVAYTFGEFASSFYSLAPPGVMWNYSNPNFSLAGLMVEELDGRPWADIVEADVFAPLGMTRSVARKADVDDNVATGVGVTAPDDETIENVSLDETWESAFVRPAGLVWSTPSDQMRFAQFLVDGNNDVVSDEHRASLVAEQVALYPDLPGGYGYGVMVGRGVSLGTEYRDIPVWSHGGNTWTHTSTFYVLPEQRFAISILSNGLGDDFSQSVATAILTLADLPAPGEGSTPPFDPAGLDELVGSYFDENNAGELIISRDGDSLRLDAPLLDDLDIPYEHEMTPLSTRVWMVNVQEQDLDFAFIDGPEGETYLRNRAVVAIRPAMSSPRPLVGPSVATPSRRASIERALLFARLSSTPALMFPEPLTRGKRRLAATSDPVSR
jgi:CubicO group peptidase (beta-lactamase class C family)